MQSYRWKFGKGCPNVEELVGKVHATKYYEILKTKSGKDRKNEDEIGVYHFPLESVVLVLLEGNAWNITLATDEMCQDSSFVNRALSINPGILEFRFFQCLTKAMMSNVLYQDGMMYQHIPSEWMDDEDLIQ